MADTDRVITLETGRQYLLKDLCAITGPIHELEGPLRIDRMEVPNFYVTNKRFVEWISNPRKNMSAGWSHEPKGQVYAQSGYHEDGWLTLGYVSKQTPLGQGTGIGFNNSWVTKATMEQVKEALSKDHPHGANFLPISHFPRFLRGGWMTPIGSTRSSREELALRIEEMLERWPEIAASQRKLLGVD